MVEPVFCQGGNSLIFLRIAWRILCCRYLSHFPPQIKLISFDAKKGFGRKVGNKWDPSDGGQKTSEPGHVAAAIQRTIRGDKVMLPEKGRCV